MSRFASTCFHPLPYHTSVYPQFQLQVYPSSIPSHPIASHNDSYSQNLLAPSIHCAVNSPSSYLLPLRHIYATYDQSQILPDPDPHPQHWHRNPEHSPTPNLHPHQVIPQQECNPLQLSLQDIQMIPNPSSPHALPDCCS